MAEEFGKAVEDGLKLSKRLYFGKDRSVSPPQPPTMEKSAASSGGWRCSNLPTAAMLYAVIPDPAIVDNPDIPSYQPHVHGRCDPPALIPLQMNDISLEAHCFLDTALVTLTGSWRLHCVMASRCCDCRIAIPMGEQGSILGVEVDTPRNSYQLISTEDTNGNTSTGKVAPPQDAATFLKQHIFTLTIPEVDGGSNLFVKVHWSQKLLSRPGHLSLEIPFTFPGFVTPAGKKMSKKEKIKLDVNSGADSEVLCRSTSHPLKELKRQAGKLGYLYESEVLTWSKNNFSFSYTVSSSQIFGGVFLQSPSAYDADQRDIFCLYLYPGDHRDVKVFKREVVFVVDISGSMRGRPLEDTKNVISEALTRLDPGDSFSIIAFNEEIFLYSLSMESASKEAIEKATIWISMNFVPGGGTDILQPLNKAMELLSDTANSIPIIFLVTDGAVEDERKIIDMMRSKRKDQGSISPRVYAFGIGSFCNQYFLQLLAISSRGRYDATFEEDLIEIRMRGLIEKALSGILANISMGNLDNLDQLEVYPSYVPDLLQGSPLTVSGRYSGDFPHTLKTRGISADMRNFEVDLKVQKATGPSLDKVYAKEQVDLLTAQAWFSESKQLEDKVAKLSAQTGLISEYTNLILYETKRQKIGEQGAGKKEVPNKINPQKFTDTEGQKVIFLKNLGIGFGNVTATVENIPPGAEQEKLPEAAQIFVNAASNCCGRICNHCCCMCCIQTCSKINDQCAIVLTQLCTALACFGCIECCSDVCCCSTHDG